MLTLMALALFIGACTLCSAGAGSGNSSLLGAGYAFGSVGFLLMVYVFLSIRKGK